MERTSTSASLPPPKARGREADLRPATPVAHGGAAASRAAARLPIEPHADSPARSWVVVRQPKAEPDRVAFDPAGRRFTTTSEPSPLHLRGFDGVAGWLAGLGEPPGPHLGALVLTTADPAPGTVLEVGVHGLVRGACGEPVIVAIDLHHTPCHGAVDLERLPRPLRWMLAGPTGVRGPDPDGLGGAAARAYLAAALQRHRARLHASLRWPDPESWEPPDADLAGFGPAGPWPW